MSGVLRLFSLTIICFFLFENVAAKRNRIIGGQLAHSESWFPYMVSLQIRGQHLCGAGIISTFHILTAAHCVTYAGTKEIVDQRYQVALHILNVKNSDAPRFDVERVFVSVRHNSEYKTNDIAVLKLKVPLDLSPYGDTSILRLPNPAMDYAGVRATITGYGFNMIKVKKNPETGFEEEYEGYSDNRLRYAFVDIISVDDCKKKNYNQLIEETHICGHVMQRGEKHEGICSGDSGGPLVYDNTIIGVVSASPLGCVEHEFDATYTRVSSFLEFINLAIYEIPSDDVNELEIKI